METTTPSTIDAYNKLINKQLRSKANAFLKHTRTVDLKFQIRTNWLLSDDQKNKLISRLVF